MPVSARTIERRITDIAKNVNKLQTIAFKTANVFSVALQLDESIDINDNSRSAVVTRYCRNGEVHDDQLCFLKPIYARKDILDTFAKHFEERGLI